VNAPLVWLCKCLDDFFIKKNTLVVPHVVAIKTNIDICTFTI
jgi:hypothetical protein